MNLETNSISIDSFLNKETNPGNINLQQLDELTSSSNKDLLDNLSKNINIEKNINQEQIDSLLAKIKTNKTFQKFSNMRNGLGEDDKLKIYNNGAQNIFSASKNGLRTLNPLTGPFRPAIIRTFQKGSIKEQIHKDIFYAQAEPTRMLVHLGLLSTPNGLSQENLIKNIKKDEKSMNRKMFILEKCAMIIPELKPAYPLIKQLRSIMKTSSGVATELMIKQNQDINITDNLSA
ncbi:MAG: hypothetical protein M0P94_01800 [Candidatus Absconditabacterales bacterium]|nr:hypothetical protein [Candidatus Absconditabacterales bacterium]